MHFNFPKMPKDTRFEKKAVYERLISIYAYRFLPKWLINAIKWIAPKYRQLIEPLPLKNNFLYSLVALPRISYGIYFPWLMLQYQPVNNEVQIVAEYFVKYIEALKNTQEVALHLHISSFVFEGLFFALGLNTRFAAMYFLWVTIPYLFSSLYPFNWCLLGFVLSSILVLVTGSGKFGMDYWLFKIPFLKKYFS